jgi:hypothetical protein
MNSSEARTRDQWREQHMAREPLISAHVPNQQATTAGVEMKQTIHHPLLSRILKSAGGAVCSSAHSLLTESCYTRHGANTDKVHDRLWVFENRVLRTIFGPNRQEATRGERKMHNE